MELDLFSSSADFSFENKEKTEENKVSMAQRSEMETVNKEKTDNIIEAEMELKELKKEDIIESCVKYFKGDALAADVWFNKYALRDGERVFELNPDQMHRRLAREFARIERKYSNPMSEDEIYELLKDFKRLEGEPS